MDTHKAGDESCSDEGKQEKLLAFVEVVKGLELSPPPAIPPQSLGKRLLRQQASRAGTFGQLRPLA